MLVKTAGAPNAEAMYPTRNGENLPRQRGNQRGVFGELPFVTHQLYLDDVRDTDARHHTKGERFDELRG